MTKSLTTLLAFGLLCAGHQAFAQTHALRVEIAGTGHGRVMDCRTAEDCAGAQIDCGTQCAAVYPDGASVLLNAAPDADSTFGGWLVNGEPPVSFDLKMTADATITAIFTRTPSVTRTLTVPFLDGVNLASGATEHDDTLITFGSGTMQNVTNILLPDVPNLFHFSADVSLHFEYRQAQIIIVPAASVTAMAEITAPSDISVWRDPARQPVAATQTILLRQSDGRIRELSQFELMQDAWAVRFDVRDLTGGPTP